VKESVGLPALEEGTIWGEEREAARSEATIGRLLVMFDHEGGAMLLLSLHSSCAHLY